MTDASDKERSAFIRRLTAATEALAAGDADVPEPLPVDVSDPELAELGQAFNEMLDRVHQRRQLLEEREAAFRTALNRLGDRKASMCRALFSSSPV